jgi:hypothetical protein
VRSRWRQDANLFAVLIPSKTRLPSDAHRIAQPWQPTLRRQPTRKPVLSRLTSIAAAAASPGPQSKTTVPPAALSAGCWFQSCGDSALSSSGALHPLSPRAHPQVEEMWAALRRVDHQRIGHQVAGRADCPSPACSAAPATLTACPPTGRH